MAAAKIKKPVESIISETVNGYVSWFVEQNRIKNHSLFFFNVPAPIFQKEFSSDLNSEAARIIKLFNDALAKNTLDYNFNIIDVFEFTVGHDGFSDGSFHIDNRHLSSDAIPMIEKQIGTFL